MNATMTLTSQVESYRIWLLRNAAAVPRLDKLLDPWLERGVGRESRQRVSLSVTPPRSTSSTFRGFALAARSLAMRPPSERRGDATLAGGVRCSGARAC